MMTVTTKITKDSGSRSMPFDRERLYAFIDKVTNDIRIPSYVDQYKEKVIKTIEAKEQFSAEEITQLLLLTAAENNDVDMPEWTYAATSIFLRDLYKKAAYNRSYDAEQKYGSYYGLQKRLGHLGIYDPTILRDYTREEIEEAASFIDPEKDHLLTYAGLRTLSDRYLAKGYDGKEVYELPQERWLTIALTLMSQEDRSKRMALVKEAYWALSNLYMTVATPTLANAGKKAGQLSSCFIDTVDDSLQGIYDSNTDIANVSKYGGGVGVYIGKVRAANSDIRGYKNTSSGVVPWIRQINNTAVNVDQLGTRAGAVAVYLDVWHADIFEFLDLRLNNGDERKRAHDVFTGVSLPDVFMEAVEARSDWYLFDPHEVRKVFGWSLEDSYDEEKGSGTFRERYEQCVQSNELTSRKKVKAIDIMKRIMQSQLETGTPYMFYRDEVNRMNANKHEGIIYSSNLCTEIMQNMSETVVIEQIQDDGEILVRKKPGDFVVCNLSSINLGRAVKADVLPRLIPIQVRMLDNVIDINQLPVVQAQMTNHKYRAIGLGTFGWHHLLAQNHIAWDDPEAEKVADQVYEDIAYRTIQASADLAIEKGAYPAFPGSEWENGRYFERHGYFDQDEDASFANNDHWKALAEQVRDTGIRNGYLIAVAPNSSTALIAGSTQGIDPFFGASYVEEKKDYRVTVTAPDITGENYKYYEKNAFQQDQFASIRHNAARQKHVDQSQSFNLYVPASIKAKTLLELHLTAWSSGLKTTYYVRSSKVDIRECEWCQS